MTTLAPPARTVVASGPSYLAEVEQAVNTRLATLATAPPVIMVDSLGDRDALSGPPGRPPAGGGHDTVRVYLNGRLAILGPVGHRDRPRPPCDECLARHWQAAQPLPLREALEQFGATGVGEPPPFVTPFTVDAIAGLLHASLERCVTGRPGTGAVFLLDLERLVSFRHALLPHPECASCGVRTPDTRAAAALTLGSAPKAAPGSFRLVAPAEYDLDVDAFVNPVCGMLGPEVRREFGSVSAAWAAGRISLNAGNWIHPVNWAGHANSYGDSVRIGLIEGLERYAGLANRAKTASVVTSLRTLREAGERHLDPRDCGTYAAQAYDANHHLVPFSETDDLPWVWGYSLRDSEPVLVPEVLPFYYAHRTVRPFVQETSTGCATGSCLTEAVYFGLMEVIERDAFLLAWFGQAALPEIDPQSSSSEQVREMTDRLAMYGFEARFFDARMTFPIPVVIGASVREDDEPGTLCFGAGASLDPEAAIRAALSEISTDAPRLGRWVKDQTDRLRSFAADFANVRELHDHATLYGLPEMRRYASFLVGERGQPRPPKLPVGEAYARRGPVLAPGNDLLDDLQRCVKAVTAQGFDVVVDQTFAAQRERGLHTVSVFIPGLLPLDFGWHRQRALRMPRLRTALRQAGLRDSDLRPAEFNPAPHPFP